MRRCGSVVIYTLGLLLKEVCLNSGEVDKDTRRGVVLMFSMILLWRCEVMFLADVEGGNFASRLKCKCGGREK